MICILCWTTKMHQKTFRGHHIQSWRKFKDFSRLCEPWSKWIYLFNSCKFANCVGGKHSLMRLAFWQSTLIVKTNGGGFLRELVKNYWKVSWQYVASLDSQLNSQCLIPAQIENCDSRTGYRESSLTRQRVKDSPKTNFSIILHWHKCWNTTQHGLVEQATTCLRLKQDQVKVIPLKLFYYQTFFETWHNQHSWYEHWKNAIKRWGHRACLRFSRLLNWGIFTGCALKIRIPFLQN